MKGLRSFLVLLVVAAALGGFLYYDSKHEPADDKKQDKVFADVAGGQDRAGHGEGRRPANRRPSQKQGAALAGDAAGDGAGRRSGAVGHHVEPVIARSPARDRRTGVGLQAVRPRSGAHRSRVQVRRQGADAAARRRRRRPAATSTRECPTSRACSWCRSYLEATFNKSTFDLRDKTILKIDRDKVERVEIDERRSHGDAGQAGSGLARSTTPFDARADFGAIEGILGRLNSTPMKSIAPSDAADAKALKEYGLDKPPATVRVTSGSAQAGLAIGKSAGEGVVYAKDLSRPMVFTIEARPGRRAEEAGRRLPASRICSTRARSTRRASRSPAAGRDARVRKGQGDAWKQVAPAAKAADAAKVEALLTALTNARATGFEPKPAATGLDTPELTVAIKFDDGQKHGESHVRARREPTPSRGATATPPRRRSTPPRSTASSRRSTR